MNCAIRPHRLYGSVLRANSLRCDNAWIASRPRLVARPSRQACRSISSTSHLLKKGGKATRSDNTHADTAPASADPFDTSELQSSIDDALRKLKDDLSKLRAGGRFNPETVEDLRVRLNKESKSTERLGDLAQVVPKGRTLTILVGDSDHVKIISSAILSSSLSLTPQPDAHNANQLNIALPPPTSDTRRLAVQAASQAADVANSAIKTARGAHQKKLRSLQLSKSARPDDVRAAGTVMEKAASDAANEVKKTVDSAKKVLESA